MVGEEIDPVLTETEPLGDWSGRPMQKVEEWLTTAGRGDPNRIAVSEWVHIQQRHDQAAIEAV